MQYYEIVGLCLPHYISYFYPSSYYKLTAYPVDKVPSEVSAHAGATLKITAPSSASSAKLAVLGESSTTTSIEEPETSANVASTSYYSINGTEQSGLKKGMNIVKTVLTNGKTVTRKVMVK